MTWANIPWNPPARTLRQFGVLCMIFCDIVAVAQLWAERPMPAAILASIGAVVGLVAYWRPQALRPVFVSWLVLVFPVGWLVLHSCLAVVYFGILTPIGLVFRLWGRDILQLRSRPEAETYWQTKPTPPVGNYYKTF